DLLAAAVDQVLQTAAEHVVRRAGDDLLLHQVAGAVPAVAGEGLAVALFRAVVPVGRVGSLEGRLPDPAGLDGRLGPRDDDADPVPGAHGAAVRRVLRLQRVLGVHEGDHALGDAEDVVDGDPEQLAQLARTARDDHATRVRQVDASGGD